MKNKHQLCILVFFGLVASGLALDILSNFTVVQRALDPETNKYTLNYKNTLTVACHDTDFGQSFSYNTTDSAGVRHNVTIKCNKAVYARKLQLVGWVPEAVHLYHTEVCSERTTAGVNTTISQAAEPLEVLQSSESLREHTKHLSLNNLNLMKVRHPEYDYINEHEEREYYRDLHLQSEGETENELPDLRAESFSHSPRREKLVVSSTSKRSLKPIRKPRWKTQFFGGGGILKFFSSFFAGTPADQSAIDEVRNAQDELRNSVSKWADKFNSFSTQLVDMSKTQADLNDNLIKSDQQQLDLINRNADQIVRSERRTLDASGAYARSLAAALTNITNTQTARLNELGDELATVYADIARIGVSTNSGLTNLTMALNNKTSTLARSITILQQEVDRRTTDSSMAIVDILNQMRDIVSAMRRDMGDIDTQLELRQQWQTAKTSWSNTDWEPFVNVSDGGLNPNVSHIWYQAVRIDTIYLVYTKNNTLNDRRDFVTDRYDLMCNVNIVLKNRLTWTSFIRVFTSIGDPGCDPASNDPDLACGCWVVRRKRTCAVLDTVIIPVTRAQNTTCYASQETSGFEADPDLCAGGIKPFFKERYYIPQSAPYYSNFRGETSGEAVDASICFANTVIDDGDEIITDPADWEAAVREHCDVIPSTRVRGQAYGSYIRVFSAQKGSFVEVPPDISVCNRSMVDISIGIQKTSYIYIMGTIYMQAFGMTGLMLDQISDVAVGRQPNGVKYNYVPFKKTTNGISSCVQMGWINVNRLNYLPLYAMTTVSGHASVEVTVDGSLYSVQEQVLIAPEAPMSFGDGRYFVGFPDNTNEIFDVPTQFIADVGNPAARWGTITALMCKNDTRSASLAAVGCSRGHWDAINGGVPFDPYGSTVTAGLFKTSLASDGTCVVPRQRGGGTFCEIRDFYNVTWSVNTSTMHFEMKRGTVQATVEYPGGGIEQDIIRYKVLFLFSFIPLFFY